MTRSLDEQIEVLKQCQVLAQNEVKDLCEKAMEILAEESDVLDIEAPVTVRLAFLIWSEPHTACHFPVHRLEQR